MPSSDVDMHRFAKEKQPCYSPDCKIANGENILLRDLKICEIHWRSYVSFFILQFICLCVCHCSESLSTILTSEFILTKKKKNTLGTRKFEELHEKSHEYVWERISFFDFFPFELNTCVCACVCILYFFLLMLFIDNDISTHV